MTARRLSGADPAPPASVADQLHRALRAMTPAERRVGRTLIAGYPVAGLGTVAALAEQSSTSSATVVRLVQKLGFEGFPQFQLALREELATRTSGPVDRIDRGGLLASSDTPMLARTAAAATETVASIPDTVPESEFDAAVALLADVRRPVKLVGGRITDLHAEYLMHHLGRSRKHVSMFATSPRARHSAVLEIDRRDVLVVFDVRRYDSDLASIVAAAAARGAVVVLLTDVLMSPIASSAEVVLSVRVDAPSPFDTTVGVLVVVEALASAVIAKLGDRAVRHMHEWDKLAGQAPG